MGADIYFYIQKKNVETGKWENIFLYTASKQPVGIWRCGWDAFGEIKIYWKSCKDNIDKLAVETGWTLDEDDDLISYCASLAKIRYFAEKNEIHPHDTEEDYFDRKNFYKRLEIEIDAYLTFTENDFIDMDDIRIVAFISC